MESRTDFLKRMVVAKTNQLACKYSNSVYSSPADFAKLLYLAECSEVPDVSYGQLRDEFAPFAVADYVKASALLETYGATKLPEVKARDYGGFLVGLRAAKAAVSHDAEIQALRLKASRLGREAEQLGKLAGEVFIEAGRLRRSA